MDAPPTRHAWAWRDLALVRQRLKAPRSDVIAAYKRASELLPHEDRFKTELERFLARPNATIGIVEDAESDALALAINDR